VLWPRTGKTHQLRAHLTSLGAPLLGDALYGGAPTAQRPLLHAHALAFPHPVTGARTTLLAPVPEDLARLFAESGVRVPEGLPVGGS
jgi:23S rRNA pseudouridine1911/1915/1917 synthase